MLSEILDLIHRKRRSIHEQLNKKKRIRPEIYFIVLQNETISEIIIPGSEAYFSSPQLKAQIKYFVQAKWDQYNQKTKMQLLAVVTISDMYMSERLLESGEAPTEAEALKMMETLDVPPSQDPKALNVIGFYINLPEEIRFYGYPYNRKGKNIVFGEPMINIETYKVGNLGAIFPKSNNL